MPDATFYIRDGLVWIDLGESWHGFTEAMNDGISTLSPRGSKPELSMFWIDHAARGLSGAPGSQVTGGNTTRILLSDAEVIAHSDYELFDDEHMRSDEFADLLKRWREATDAAFATGDRARPQHAPYQRNPPLERR